MVRPLQYINWGPKVIICCRQQNSGSFQIWTLGTFIFYVLLYISDTRNNNLNWQYSDLDSNRIVAFPRLYVHTAAIEESVAGQNQILENPSLQILKNPSWFGDLSSQQWLSTWLCIILFYSAKSVFLCKAFSFLYKF